MVKTTDKGKKKRLIGRTKADVIFDTVNVIIMCFLLFIFIFPLYYVVIASISDINELAMGNVTFWPRGFTMDAYRSIMINDQIWTGYINSIIYAVGSVIWTLVLLLPISYALSKKYMFGRTFIGWFFLLTMYFSGGLIPTFLLYQSLGLVNSRLAVIVGSVSVFSIVVTRTFFTSNIPEELFESVRMDGGNELTCFFRIALPLSGAIIAVMALFTAVGSWNSFFTALVYFSRRELFPLQLILRNIIMLNEQMIAHPDFGLLEPDMQAFMIQQARLGQSMRYAIVFIASAPLLIAYPFVQKFFVKGVMIGSIKG